MSHASMMEPQLARYVQVNDINIYYEEYGQGEPLILLHGGTATIRAWDPQIAAFAPHFRVIAMDSRGHGKTNNPAGELTYTQMAEDVVGFISALALDKPSIFGYSDGGQIALELGIRYPALPNALVLGGTCYRFPEQYFEALTGFGIDRSGATTVARMLAEAPDWVAALKIEHERPGEPDTWKTLMEQISPLWWNVHDYSREDLRKITAPTMILQSDRDEGVDVEQAVEMYRGIPTAELAVLPNATHGQLGAFSDGVVIDFLKRYSKPRPTPSND
jgi:pimeloyl-ACP methyl ester carboxylesterase